jgi:hypothetical protein
MDEFWKAVAEIDWSRPKEIEYRVYYDAKTGQVLDYTNDQRPGDYILVDRETFHKHKFDVTVRDGKLVTPIPPRVKLVPGEKGRGCHSHDITILSDENSVYWTIKKYEQN